jgi:tetratricopeptide (TPR) repeat protein
MAYSQKVDEVDVERRKPNQVFFGFSSPHVPFAQVVLLDDEIRRQRNLDKAGLAKLQAAAKENLEKSIASFRRALELDPGNATAQLGLAWTLDQAGEDEEAVRRYRETIAEHWDKEKELPFASVTFRSVVAEAASYLLEHLDESKDKTEIADLKAKSDHIASIRRMITPIAIPLDGGGWSSVYDPSAAVRFDADGSGILKAWTWIQPRSGWLVYDHAREGRITSALQLFGNVTFWCFWDNGYDALRTLDDDQDGWLRGAELDRLGIWQDRNQNGVSESGEVKPLLAHQIVAISCSGTRGSFDGQPIWHNPRGVVRLDGRSVPTFDVILRTVEASEPDARPPLLNNLSR